MNKQELQTQILSNTKSLFRLASAISNLPESGTRGELIYKHNKVAQRLANLQADLGQIDNNACYFGFTDKCPGSNCADCKHWLEKYAKIRETNG